MICVYQILNKVNGKSYIGSTVNLVSRKSTHFLALKNNKHHSEILQRAYNKYGLESFVFNILEECTRENKQELEQLYLDIYKPEYNTSKSAKCPMLGRKHSEKTIALFKLRPAKCGKDNYMFGRPWSDELRKKILESRIGLKRSQEFKETQRKNAINKNLAQYIAGINKVKIVDDLGNVYNSLGEAAIINEISTQTVCDILKGRHSKTRKGRSFKYYENTQL